MLGDSLTTYFETSLSKVEPNRREDVNLSGQKWAAYFSSNCTVSDGSHDIYTYYVTSVVPMPLFLMFIYIYKFSFACKGYIYNSVQCAVED